jgi:hypothetical protein
VSLEGERLRRAEWRVVPVTQTEARDLITRTHYAGGCPNTSVARHGLMRVDSDKLEGVALWLPPIRQAALSVRPDDPRGVLALSRLCVADDVPANAASYLLGASMRMIDRDRWPTLLTYADTRHGHTGAIYRATNWRCLGIVPGSRGHAWRHRVTGEQRSQKRGRVNLAASTMIADGFERLPAAPKVKFVHEVAR